MLPSTLATFCGTQEGNNKCNILQNSNILFLNINLTTILFPPLFKKLENIFRLYNNNNNNIIILLAT